MGLTAAGAVARVGTIDQAHIDYASDLKESMPAPLRQAVRDPLGAQATVFALLLDPGESVQKPSSPGWTPMPCPPRYARPAC